MNNTSATNRQQAGACNNEIHKKTCPCWGKKIVITANKKKTYPLSLLEQINTAGKSDLIKFEFGHYMGIGSASKSVPEYSVLTEGFAKYENEHAVSITYSQERWFIHYF